MSTRSQPLSSPLLSTPSPLEGEGGGEGVSPPAALHSSLFTGSVYHHRLEPTGHLFEYPLYFYAFDLAELDTLDQTLPGFGYNRLRPVSLHDRDYLDPTPQPIATKLHAHLAKNGVSELPARVILVTAARCWNYVFNPASFYLCFAADGRLACAVAEVNNTFGDRHLYMLPHLEPGASPGEFIAAQNKAFHVSPFNNMQGRYIFTFRCTPDDIDIRVDIERDGCTVFRSRLSGAGVPLTSRRLWTNLARRPFSAALTVPRITFQAMRLRFGRKLRVHPRPEPVHPQTIIRRAPGLMERLARTFALKHLARIRHGELTITLPGDPNPLRHGSPGTEPSARIDVHRHSFFTRILRSGDVGLGEAYVAGDFSCDDPARVLELLIANRAELSDGNLALALAGRAANRMRHLTRPNTRRQGRRNIHAHYDLGNEFYELFLDRSLMYSCAMFGEDTHTLEDAQLHKVHMLIDKAQIRADHHVLEIGCGWGTFAIEAVRRTGCRVTALTVSEAQHRLATERVRQAGLSDRIEIRFCDYRDATGSFDRIVSIEMLEAVGHRYFETFFRCCDRLLSPEGLVVLQVITIPDHRYNAYLRSCDWIQKHVFPGGHLPSLTALSRAMEAGSALHVEALENIGPHYATTLRLWRERFDDEAPRVRALGFDDTFIRKWRYYLAYCEAAFASRTLNTLQLVLTRPNNADLAGPPRLNPHHNKTPSLRASVSPW